MKITGVKVYDLHESIVASGFPKLVEYTPEKFEREVETMQNEVHVENNPHFKRACRLAAAPDGSGHKTFLSGILVSANVTATNAWWLQFGRYHYQQIVSSQSKMHCLKAMLGKHSEENSLFHVKVQNDFIKSLKALENEDEETLVYNCPVGLELTARITTNYLQLRTIWVQRRNHKLKEWHDFCGWIERLPFAKQLIVCS